jgi:hypothetical protein
MTSQVSAVEGRERSGGGSAAGRANVGAPRYALLLLPSRQQMPGRQPLPRLSTSVSCARLKRANTHTYSDHVTQATAHPASAHPVLTLLTLCSPMWTFWLEPVSRRMCIRQRIEWDGLLLGSDHEELLAMTVADL